MAFSEPEQVIAQIPLGDNMTVIDLGAGTGAYSVAAGRRVPGGKVYAVEVMEDFLSKIKSNARAAGLANVETVWGDIESPHGTKIKDGAGDLAVVANVLFQVTDKKALFEEASRILKPGGRLLIVEWSDSFAGLGPSPDAVVSKEAAREAALRAGFSYDGEVSAGDHHYGLLFHRS